MRVYNGGDSHEEGNLSTLNENLTDWLWKCGNGSWNDCKQVYTISLTSIPWLYRGEGNANLVISLPREKVIVRLQKLEYDVKITSSLLEEREKQLMRDVEFYRKVMISLLGTSFFHPPILARISEKEVSQIDQKLINIRPRFRLSKGIRLGLVTIHPDYTYLPPIVKTLPSIIYNESLLMMEASSTFCIEIKPKQGWIPLLDRKHPKCAFCMNQYLKVMKKRVLGISQYCPLDLFSGNILRMKRAVRNLLLNPQNNLKIFKNGNLVFSDDNDKSYTEVLTDFFQLGNRNEINIERLVDRWCSLIVSCLCTKLSCTPFSKSSCFCTELVQSSQQVPYQIPNSTFSPLNGHIKPCDWSSQSLPSHSILQRILNVQQLQNSNFSTVCSLYKERCASENDYSYLDSLIDSDGNVDIIQRYLLATTAKDCSIFIALQSTVKLDMPYKNYYIKDCEGQGYRLNIGISDIDPKPLSCIGKHIKRDKEILDAVMQFVHHSKD